MTTVSGPARRRAEARFMTACISAAALSLAPCDDKITGDVDHTPPTVEIDAPSDAANVSGVGVWVDVDAADAESGVDRVEMSVNGVDVFVDEVAPYSLFLPTVAELEGTTFSIQVTAFDLAGNSATDAISVVSLPHVIFQLTSDTNADRLPSWSPDGGRITFQSNRFGQWDVFVMDANGSNEFRLTTNLNNDENPSWSSGGEYVVFDSDRAGEDDIWRMLVVAGEASALALTFGNNEDREPAWAPDGSQILFSSSRGIGNQFDLWVMTATGLLPQQITSFAEPDLAPAWAPSMDFIAFTSSLNFATAHVYVKDIAADTVFPVSGTVGYTEYDPAWSPFGNAILYTRAASAQSNVWIFVVEREFPSQVTFGSGVFGDGGAAWSPDGTTIAFHSDRNGNDDIYVMK